MQPAVASKGHNLVLRNLDAVACKRLILAS